MKNIKILKNAICLDNCQLNNICQGEHKICERCYNILCFEDKMKCPICRRPMFSLPEPILVKKGGKNYYYLDEKLHRVNLPAITAINYEEYYFLGLRHRPNNRPAVVTPFRNEFWFMVKA